MATTATPDPTAATADATVTGREGEGEGEGEGNENESLHASIVSSAHGYFRWLSAQRPPDDCSASSSSPGDGLQRYAGKGKKVLAALVEEFPDLIPEEAADEDGSVGGGGSGDAGPQQQQPALELGRDLSRWLLERTPPPPPSPGYGYEFLPRSPPGESAPRINVVRYPPPAHPAMTETHKALAPTTPQAPQNKTRLVSAKSRSEAKRKRRSQARVAAGNKVAVDGVSGAGLDAEAKRRMSLIRAENRKRRVADGVAIRRLERKVKELEAANRREVEATAKATTANANSVAPASAAPKVSAPPLTWDERYEQLKEFHRGHGHTRVPTTYPANQRLARWVNTQRNNYRAIQAGKDPLGQPERSRMTDERMKKLNDLGFVWYAKKTTPKTWEERLEELLQFKAENGHTRVPRTYNPNPPLGNWVHSQRKLYSSKDPLIMGERADRLEAIGFEFKVRDGVLPWEESFERLIAYRAKHGHLPGEGGEGEENAGESKSSNDNDAKDSGDDHAATDSKEIIRLHNWIAFQRATYCDWKEGRKTSLTKTRIKQLESIGFNWNYDPSKKLKRRGERKRINRNPPTYAAAPSWEERIQQLDAYKAEHGDANPPPSYGSGDTKLGMWVSNMKKLHSRLQRGKGHIPTSMTPERFAQLEEMGVKWSKPGPVLSEHFTWEERYEQLLHFKAQKGHTRVPQGWSENKGLGRWVSTQRQQHKLREEGKPSYMTDERLSKLLEVGFVFVAGKEQRRISGGGALKRETGEDDGDSEESSEGSDEDDEEVEMHAGNFLI